MTRQDFQRVSKGGSMNFLRHSVGLVLGAVLFLSIPDRGEP
ncbi:MAG: hypothetical protein OJF50_005736 [Nitrospira sp.]|nr:hypothetical protein [Nitrospira sp.]